MALEPNSAGIRDSRPLARALLNKREGAIADWQYYIEHQQGLDQDQRMQRQEWINLLRAGGTFVLKDELRQELLKQ